jgi:hypothetical protein
MTLLTLPTMLSFGFPPSPSAMAREPLRRQLLSPRSNEDRSPPRDARGGVSLYQCVRVL